MKIHSEKIRISTQKNEPVDITDKIQKVVRNSKIKEGLCNIFVKHTTSFVIINENEGNLKKDFLKLLYRLIPENEEYNHADGNAHAHLKEILFNSGKTIPISNNKLELGTWQSILFIDPDGPRERGVLVTILGE